MGGGMKAPVWEGSSSKKPKARCCQSTDTRSGIRSIADQREEDKGELTWRNLDEGTKTPLLGNLRSAEEPGGPPRPMTHIPRPSTLQRSRASWGREGGDTEARDQCCPPPSSRPRASRSGKILRKASSLDDGGAARRIPSGRSRRPRGGSPGDHGARGAP